MVSSPRKRAQHSKTKKVQSIKLVEVFLKISKGKRNAISHASRELYKDIVSSFINPCLEKFRVQKILYVSSHMLTLLC